MMLTDAIRDAATAHEITFLLTSYVEAACHGDQLSRLAEAARETLAQAA